MISAQDLLKTQAESEKTTVMESLDALVRKAAADGRTSINVPDSLCIDEGCGPTKFKGEGIKEKLIALGYQVKVQWDYYEPFEGWIVLSWEQPHDLRA